MCEQQRKQICDTHKRGLACHDCVVSGLVSGLVCDFDLGVFRPVQSHFHRSSWLYREIRHPTVFVHASLLSKLQF